MKREQRSLFAFWRRNALQLVIVVSVGWNIWFDVLLDTRLLDDLTSLGGLVGWITWKNLPMIEDGLWESLATSSLSEIGNETKGFVDREVGLNVVQRSTRTLSFLKDVTTTSGQYTIDTTHGLFWNLNFDEVDWLEDRWLGEQESSIEHTTGSWDDLTTTTMDSISM